MARMKCPECDGEKMIRGPIHINRGEAGSEWVDEMPCLRCRGTGEVPVEMAAWIAVGKEHRQRRVARGESILECATRLGVGSADVSAMEHGRRDPARLTRAND